jgi:hypothetical protein
MKTTVLVISFVGLISTTLSLPASIEDRAPPGCTSNIVPNADATISAINSWNEDVMMVNAFLNTADSLSGTALSDAATTAFAFANNEPAELGILACIPNLGVAANNAIESLASVFGDDVLNPLETIINEPTNTKAVTSAINLINSIRCCTVLPSVDALWLAAANALKVESQVNVVAPLEDACSKINC